MRRLRSHRGADGRGSQDCGTRGVIAVSFHCAPVLFGGPLVCIIRFKAHARTVVLPTLIARRMSWPKANKEVIESRRNPKKKRSKQLLQRRAKRAQRRGGNRRSDRAKRK